MDILIIAVYVIGGFVCYLIIKKLFKDNNSGKWTIGNRGWALFGAPFSWIGVLIIILFIVALKIIELSYSDCWDRDAKW